MESIKSKFTWESATQVLVVDNREVFEMMVKTVLERDGLHKEAQASRRNGQYASYESYLEASRGFDERYKGMVAATCAITGLDKCFVTNVVESRALADKISKNF